MTLILPTGLHVTCNNKIIKTFIKQKLNGTQSNYYAPIETLIYLYHVQLYLLSSKVITIEQV